MLDRGRASQLLKAPWSSVSSFAQELYSIVTSPGPATVESPLTVQSPPGTIALKVQRSAPTPSAQQREAARAFRPPTNEPIPAPPEKVTANRGLDTSFRNVKQSPAAKLAVGVSDGFTAVSPLAAAAESPPVGGGVAGGEHPNTPPAATTRFEPVASVGSVGFTPVSSLSAPEFTGVDTPGPSFTPFSDPFSVPSTATPATPEPVPSRPVNRPETPRKTEEVSYTDPYKAPVVSVEGPVSFLGREPVQFDVAPAVFNPRTKQYDPIVDYDLERGTHIPRGRLVFEPLVGKYKSGSGTTWKVTIYPDGIPPTSGTGSNTTNYFDATVSVPNAPTGYKPAVDTWIGPILDMPSQSGKDEDDYYYFVSGSLGAYASTTGVISASDGTGVLGSGPATLCSRVGAVCTADGAAVTLYNAGGSVPTGKLVQVEAVGGGDWGVVVAPCS